MFSQLIKFKEILTIDPKLNLKMKTPTKRLLIVLTFALWTLIGTGCGTLHGFGHDVEKAGNRIKNVGN